MRTSTWLKNKRNELNMTQKELANKAGISVPAIAKIESGERFGSPETWEKIEKVIKNEGIFEPSYSYDSEDIIEELKEELEIYGPDKQCNVYYKVIDEHIFFTEYALLEDLETYDLEDIKKLSKQKNICVTLIEALDLFEAQNKI